MTSHSTSLPTEREQPDTDTQAPFANDWLSVEGENQPTRLAIAQNLGYLARSASEPFRLMLNGGWGTGKTWFINNMVKLFERDKHLAVIHINAWELDFSDDPFIAFASKLLEKVNFDEASESLISKIAAGLLKMPSISYQPTPESPSASVSLAPLIEELGGDVGKALFQKHRTMMDCRLKLQRAITEQFGPGSPKRLVFVIDELDRCEPRFAITLMERIKHFFETEGVVVIAAVDKEEMCNTVRGAFGDAINAERYLQRFYDVEYSLPKGNIAYFAKQTLRSVFEEESKNFSQVEIVFNEFGDICNFLSDTSQNKHEISIRLRDVRLMVTKIKAVYGSIGLTNEKHYSCLCM